MVPNPTLSLTQRVCSVISYSSSKSRSSSAYGISFGRKPLKALMKRKDSKQPFRLVCVSVCNFMT